MLNKEITFDRFIRGALVAAGATAAVMLINRLSDVLLPFFVAWLMAYMLFPMVKFLQYRCHMRNRVLCIVVSLLIVLTAIAAVIGIAIPPTIREFSHLQGVLVSNMRQLFNSNVANQINDYLHEYITQNSFFKIIQEKSFLEVAQAAFGQMWTLVSSAINLIIGLVGATIVILYMVFILLDYEKINAGWIRLVPQRQRRFATMVVRDVEHGMNAYFRGQALVALCVGVLFSIGFSIIGFPLAIGLGLFIGLLNMVPYLQLVAFIPTILLSLLKASQTGENFWWILIPALIVFLVVQAIQDFYLVPRIMGHVMGLNPAVILLSLSIWGSLLGLIGLIIALPLTTLLLSYYRRFVLEEVDETQEKDETEEK